MRQNSDESAMTAHRAVDPPVIEERFYTRMGKNIQDLPADATSICRRLAAIRSQHYGPRGQSAFARDLGIAPTSYAHYERDRVAPAEVLARAARLTGIRLEWLITGEGLCQDRNRTTSHPADQLGQRLINLLERAPRLQRAVEEFLQMLEGMSAEIPPVPASPIQYGRGNLIPIIGSTAAGPAHYWSELENLQGGREADANLEQLLSGHFEKTVRSAAPVVSDEPSEAEPVSLVQYSRPDDDGFLEFLSATALRRRYPQAVAWRIDGESMAPRFQDGDLVVTSPDHPAVEMFPCVARQVDQIGVNCKLFRRDGDDVLLIPVNETYPVQRVSAGKILWAWRVLGSVRLQRR
jgi:transcriptional regulator with XRE-family HTH domain